MAHTSLPELLRDMPWPARTALPLFLLMLVAVLMTYFVPDVVLWLPRQMQ